MIVNQIASQLHSFQSLQRLVQHYIPLDEQDKVWRGVETAVAVHDGFSRKNNTPYIDHVLSVTTILASWRAPVHVLVAGLLHDALKPNYANVPSLDEIRAEHGEQVAQLIHGISRLGRFGPILVAESSRTAEDVVQQLPWVAMILQQSPIAVVIKLADKLDNFQSIHALPEKRQMAYATSVLRIFVPFAERLGMRRVKRELADKAFRVLEPQLYEQILEKYPHHLRQKMIDPVLAQIEAQLLDNNISGQVTHVPRGVHDIHLAETRLGRDLPLCETTHTIIATTSESYCYQILGNIHQLWSPQPGKIIDYVASPKPNGYRALHTSVRPKPGSCQVVAIRDQNMMLVADFGLTAAWHGVDEALLPHFEEWQEPPPGKVTIMTPDGDLKLLPDGATPVDFAYAVHVGLGHQCIGALVNGRHAPLDYALKTGDVVHILTGRTSVGPSPDWLQFVVTTKAAKEIRRWLKAQKPKAAADKGWSILETYLQRNKLPLPFGVVSESLTAVSQTLGYKRQEDLLVSIAFNQRDPDEVFTILKKKYEKGTLFPASQAIVSSLNDASLPQKLARCCRPVPPDDICGYVTKQNIISIHRANCVRLRTLQPLLHVEWNEVSVRYRTEIDVQCVDRVGLVRDVSDIVSATGANMTSLHADRLEGGMSYIHLSLGDIPRTQRELIIDQLRQVPNVQKARLKGPGSSTSPQSQKMVPKRGNPYTLRPVTGDAFFGRRTELRELINHLRNVNPGEALLLWGPRRIGKTSILLQLQQNVMNSDDYVLCFIDMQRLSGRSTTVFLRYIIRTILESDPRGENIQPPNVRKMKRDPLGYFRSFLDNSPIVRNKHLVLILDEFQLLSTLTEDHIGLADVSRYFRSLIQFRSGLTIIFSGGGVLSHLLSQPATSFMLEVARHQKMGFLTAEDARALIVKPANQVQYLDAVVDQLLNLTAGHPYYLQWLCGELVASVRRDGRETILLSDLEVLLETWLPQQGEQYFSHLWGNTAGLDVDQMKLGKVLLTAVCHHPDRWIPIHDLIASVNCDDQSKIIGILSHLVQLDTLVKRHDAAYCFRIPLAAKWLRHNYSVVA